VPPPLRRAAVGQRARLPRPARRLAGKDGSPQPAGAVAIDGKTCRGARRADGTRVHLPGAADHGGDLLDHLEVGVKHNETSHFAELLGPPGPSRRSGDLRRPPHGAGEPDLAGQGQESPLHRDREGQPVAAVRADQDPALAANTQRRLRPREGHGRAETRTLKTAHVSHLDFPGARQAIKITRWRQNTATGKTSGQTVYAITSLTSAHATAPDLARLVREHWSIEAHHHGRRELR